MQNPVVQKVLVLVVSNRHYETKRRKKEVRIILASDKDSVWINNMVGVRDENGRFLIMDISVNLPIWNRILTAINFVNVEEKQNAVEIRLVY